MKEKDATTDSSPRQEIIDALLRYHRKNPLRVAFGTAVLLAEHDANDIERAYEQLAGDELVEPIHHEVVRQGAARQCYRITKNGMTGKKL